MLTVSDGRKRYFSRNEARDMFMSRVAALVPRCFSELCSPAGLELAAVARERLVQAWLGDGSGMAHFEADQAVRAYIREWQQRWNLTAVPDHVSKRELSVPTWRELSARERDRWKGSSSEISWIEQVAEKTLRSWIENEKSGEPVPSTFEPVSRPSERMLSTAHHGEPMSWDAKSETLLPYLVNDDGLDLLRWNPATERRADAMKRLSRLLDDALDAIESRYPSVDIQDVHFDWLVRFQVKRPRESQGDIACSAGLNKRRITEHVNELAALIGLEPRDGRLDGGRRVSDENLKARTVKL